MADAANVNLLVAFWAGVASFVSPCVLPLIPSYLTFISGFSLEELSEGTAEGANPRFRVLTHTLAFVLGFSLVFVALGATATGLGQLLRAHQGVLARMGGIFVVFFGLFITEWINDKTARRLGILMAGCLGSGLMFWGLANLPEGVRAELEEGLVAISLDFLLDYRAWWMFFLQLAVLLAMVLGLEVGGLFRVSSLLKDIRFNLAHKPAGHWGTGLIGITFALGWTPCVGPILGAILVLAGSEGSIARGMLLLSAYSLGLGIPFLVSAAAFTGFLKAFKRFRRHIHRLTVASGVLLMLLGAFLGTGSFTWLVGKLTAWLPFLQPRL